VLVGFLFVICETLLLLFVEGQGVKEERNYQIDIFRGVVKSKGVVKIS